MKQAVERPDLNGVELTRLLLQTPGAPDRLGTPPHPESELATQTPHCQQENSKDL